MAQAKMQQAGNIRLIRSMLFPIALISLIAIGTLIVTTYLLAANCQTGTYTPRAPIIQGAELISENASIENGIHLVRNVYLVNATPADLFSFYREAGAVCIQIGKAYTCSGSAHPYGDYSIKISSISETSLRFDLTYQWSECGLPKVLGE